MNNLGVKSQRQPAQNLYQKNIPDAAEQDEYAADLEAFLDEVTERSIAIEMGLEDCGQDDYDYDAALERYEQLTDEGLI